MSKREFDGVKIKVEFHETLNRQQLSSGEDLNTTLGKLKRWLADLVPLAFSGKYEDLTGNFILNPENKNANVFDKYLGSSVSDVQREAIESGSFKDLYLGGYWTMGGNNWRIWDFNYWKGTGDQPLNKNHLVIIPDKVLFSRKIGETEDTSGGYVNSYFYKNGLLDTNSAVESIFGDMLIQHRSIGVMEVRDGIPYYGVFVDTKCELPSEIMLYGTNIFGYSGLREIHFTGASSFVPFCDTVSKSQLALARINNKWVNISQNYWLSDVVGTGEFARINGHNRASHAKVTDALGIRPVFAIG